MCCLNANENTHYRGAQDTMVVRERDRSGAMVFLETGRVGPRASTGRGWRNGGHAPVRVHRCLPRAHVPLGCRWETLMEIDTCTLFRLVA